MNTKMLSERLAQALKSELGSDAPVYLYVNEELHELVIQVNPKGKLGPGSVLLTAVPMPTGGR